MRVGVLSLQGSAEPHAERLHELGHEPLEVRAPEQLEGLTHLVLPGGESTTIQHLLELFGLRQAIVSEYRAGRLALFGTCAGAILLGRDDGQRPPRLGFLNAGLERNAYGRQLDSFSTEIQFEAPLGNGDCHAIFIRAPRFRDLSTELRVLARQAGEPVLLEGPGVLAATFHPELTADTRIHRYFIEQVGFPLRNACEEGAAILASSPASP